VGNSAGAEDSEGLEDSGIRATEAEVDDMQDKDYVVKPDYAPGAPAANHDTAPPPASVTANSASSAPEFLISAVSVAMLALLT
jgi:hypothetical protein